MTQCDRSDAVAGVITCNGKFFDGAYCSPLLSMRPQQRSVQWIVIRHWLPPSTTRLADGQHDTRGSCQWLWQRPPSPSLARAILHAHCVVLLHWSAIHPSFFDIVYSVGLLTGFLYSCEWTVVKLCEWEQSLWSWAWSESVFKFLSVDPDIFSWTPAVITTMLWW